MGDVLNKGQKILEVRCGYGLSDVRHRPWPSRPGSGLTGIITSFNFLGTCLGESCKRGDESDYGGMETSPRFIKGFFSYKIKCNGHNKTGLSVSYKIKRKKA